MPRNRMIKPEFWSDEKTGLLKPVEKCLFISMWNFADDEGLIKANPLYLQSVSFPYDKTIKTKTISDCLEKLKSEDLVFLYSKNHQSYAWIIKFRIHQRIDKPQKPQNPAPSIQNNDYHKAIFQRDGFICHICGEYTDIMQDLNKVGSHFPSIDHVKPKKNGGSDYPSNLKTACISCNKSKGCKVPITFQEHSENGPEQKKLKERESKEKISKENIKNKNVCSPLQIVELYHEILPELPTVTVKDREIISTKLPIKIRKIWNLSKHYQDVEFWKFLFQSIRHMDFLMGKVKDFRASLFWIVGTENFEKILNGNYVGSHGSAKRKAWYNAIASQKWLEDSDGT